MKFVIFLPTLRKFSISLESLHFSNLFYKISQMQNLIQEMVMDNWKQSWKMLLQSLCNHVFFFFLDAYLAGSSQSSQD